MASIRKLEEDLAKTRDPVIRKQIEELIEKRKQERANIIDKVKRISSVFDGTDPHAAPMLGIILLLGVLFALIIWLASQYV